MNRKFFSIWVIASCLAIDLYAHMPAAPVQAIVTEQKPETLKIGYVDSNFILENLPEAKKCDAEIKSFQKQLEQEVQTKYKEFQDSLELVQQQLNSLTDEQKQQKRMELSKLQAALEELDNQRAPKIEQKYKELVTPLMARVDQVIKAIAKEQQYTFIFNKNIGPGNVLFFADEAFDLSKQVLERLIIEDAKTIKAPVIGPKADGLTNAKDKLSAKGSKAVKIVPKKALKDSVKK